MSRARGAHRFGAWARGLSAAVLVAAILAPPRAAAQEVCARLEAELASTERGGSAGRGSRRELQRLEQAYHRQRYEYDRLISVGRQYGCGGGLFSFGERHPSCGRIDAQLDRAEDTLRRLKSQRDEAAAEPSEDEDRREAVMDAMRRYGCGRPGAQPESQGLFARLFGVPRIEPRREQAPALEEQDEGEGGQRFSGSYRTLCVRTCDGYYWPINFSTTARSFATETKVCEASCPGQPVQLFVHRNPGEWSESAVSLEGKPYSESPNAFAYRSAYKPECGCQKPALSVAAAPALPKAEGPSTPIPASAKRGSSPTPAPEKVAATPRFTAPPPANASVRVVGPTFLPAQ